MKPISNILLICITCLFLSCGNKTTSDNNDQSSESEEIIDGVGGVNWDSDEENEEFEKQLEAEQLEYFKMLATASDNEIKKIILNYVFDVQEVITHLYDNDDDREIISTQLRDKYASIPLNRCFLAKTSDRIVAMAFEIYLSEESNDYKDYVENDISAIEDWYTYVAELNKNKEKLIQLIYFNFNYNKLIGKPEGFPLEQPYWEVETPGDAMSNISIESFNEISNVENACQLVYINYLVDASDNMMVFKQEHSDDIFNSDLLPIGETGWQTGCSIVIEYNDFTENNNSILAVKKTICESGEDTSCDEVGETEGEKTEPAVLLTWD